LSFFLAIQKNSIEYSAIWSGFCTLSILHIINPIAMIACSIIANVQAYAICFVVRKIPLISVTVWMTYFAFSTSFIVFPLAFVLRSV
jgi:hypothetical protein